MSWTLEAIRKKILAITGRSDGDVDDVDLNAYINRFYRYVLPHQLKPFALRDWYIFNTVASIGNYAFDASEYIGIYGPSYVDGYNLRLHLNPESFYKLYPETNTYQQGRPVDMLLYGNQITLQQVPDNVYSIKIGTYKRPAELINLTDLPIMIEWGPFIAYGAAIELLEDSGEQQRIDEIAIMYERYKLIAMDSTQTTLSPMRAVPTF